MGLFDNINLNDLGAKVGLTPEKVKAITDTLHKTAQDGAHHISALEAAAAEHGVTVAKIQEVLGHAGNQISDAATGAFNSVFNKKT
jgi:hypothetical protein